MGPLGLAVGPKAEVVHLLALTHDLQNRPAPTRGRALALALGRDPILAHSPGRAQGSGKTPALEADPRIPGGWIHRVALVTGVLSLSGAGAGPAPRTAARGRGPGLAPSPTRQGGGAGPALAAPLLRKLCFGPVCSHLGCWNRVPAGALPP